jgi:hypothetical protein
VIRDGFVCAIKTNLVEKHPFKTLHIKGVFPLFFLHWQTNNTHLCVFGEIAERKKGAPAPPANSCPLPSPPTIFRVDGSGSLSHPRPRLLLFSFDFPPDGGTSLLLNEELRPLHQRRWRARARKTVAVLGFFFPHLSFAPIVGGVGWPQHVDGGGSTCSRQRRI